MTRRDRVDAAYEMARGLDLNAGELVELGHRLLSHARELPINSTEFRSTTLAAEVLGRVDESLATLVTVPGRMAA